MTAPDPPAPRSSAGPLLIVLLAVVGVGAFLLLNRPSELPSPAPSSKLAGTACPEVAGLDPEGHPVKLSDYRGKVVLISFWATWCGPCKKQLPHEVELVTGKYKDRPFAVLGVAQDSPGTLRRFLKDHPLPWPNIADGEGDVSAQWKIRAVPSAVLVDPDGIIRLAWTDGVSPDVLWPAVDRLVAEAEKK